MSDQDREPASLSHSQDKAKLFASTLCKAETALLALQKFADQTDPDTIAAVFGEEQGREFLETLDKLKESTAAFERIKGKLWERMGLTGFSKTISDMAHGISGEMARTFAAATNITSIPRPHFTEVSEHLAWVRAQMEEGMARAKAKRKADEKERAAASKAVEEADRKAEEAQVKAQIATEAANAGILCLPQEGGGFIYPADEVKAKVEQAAEAKEEAKELRAKTGLNNNPNADTKRNPTIPLTNYEAVIERGTTYQKLLLYIGNFDLKRFLGSGTLTDDQVKRIQNFINNSDEATRAEVGLYVNTYNAFLQYGKVIGSKRASYQVEAAKLTGLIDLLESYEQAARELANSVRRGDVGMADNAPWLIEFGSTAEDGNTLFADKKIGTGNATLCVFPDGDYTLDVDGEGRLYDQIQKQAAITREALEQLKAFIEPLSDYVLAQTNPPLWPLMPNQVEVMMDYPDAIEEQSDPKKAKYFRFLLKRRREAGETITPEDERWAVYPDYNEVGINETSRQSAIGQLENAFTLWNIAQAKKKRGRKPKHQGR